MKVKTGYIPGPRPDLTRGGFDHFPKQQRVEDMLDSSSGWHESRISWWDANALWLAYIAGFVTCAIVTVLAGAW